MKRAAGGVTASGFTLIEAMIVLALVAIGLGIGLPAFNGALQRVHTANAYHLLTASLMSARSSAITRRQFVTVCPSRDGLHCRGDRVWDDGWIVFADPGKTGVPAGPDVVLRHIDALGSTIAARSTRRRVRYRPNGQATGTNLSVWMCNRNDGHLLGGVIISNTGRARSQHEEDKAKPCRFDARDPA